MDTNLHPVLEWSRQLHARGEAAERVRRVFTIIDGGGRHGDTHIGQLELVDIDEHFNKMHALLDS